MKTKTAFVLALLLGCVALLSLPSIPATSNAQAPKQEATVKKDLAQLMALFNQAEVAVFHVQHGPVEGRITDMVELFNQRFLVLVADRTGKNYIIRVDGIIAIRQNR